jgi:Icc-related predicted phosphoesterase
LHGELPELNGGDLLILAGDYTARGRSKQWESFYQWVQRQNYHKKVMVAGNHDNDLYTNNTARLESCEEFGYTYLCDTGTEFEGLKIWGSPWVKVVRSWHEEVKKFGFASDIALKNKFDLIPDGLDILVTHGPPLHILDTNAWGLPCGSMCLQNIVLEKKPKIHIFGHIHERHGHEEHGGTKFFNVAIMNENYEAVNKPTIITL